MFFRNIRIRSNFYRDRYVVLRPDLYNFAYVQKMSDLEAGNTYPKNYFIKYLSTYIIRQNSFLLYTYIVYRENGATFVGQQCFEDAVCLRSGMTYFNPEKYLVITRNKQYAPTGHTYWFNKNYFWWWFLWTCPQIENASYKVSIYII